MAALHDQPPPSGQTMERLAASLPVFFDLSRSVSLSAAEEAALLDLPAEMVARLNAAPAEGLPFDRVKLLRRLDYAIPILRRMLAALSA